MSRPSLLEALGGPGPIVVDTSVLIAYLDGGDALSAAATLLLDQLVAGGSHPAIVSAVTVTECMVRPFRSSPSAVVTAATFLGHFPNLRVRPIDHEVAIEAARVRALTGLRTPDALVIATALVAGIATIVAGDKRWDRAIDGLDGVRVVQLRASFQE
jgi:predicted nucleic acid-binding protein